MLRSADIPLDPGDAGACHHCRPRAIPVRGKTPHPLADVEEGIARALAEDPGCGIILTGSEPLAHPDLSRILKAAVRMGAGRIGVRSPGEPLADPSTTESLVTGGVRLFELPVFGSCAESHDPLIRVRGSFDGVISGIEEVRAAAQRRDLAVAVRGRVPVCGHTVRDLPSIVTRLAEAAVTEVVIEGAQGFGDRRMLDWIIAACDTGTVNRVWVSVTRVAPELLGDRALHATDPFVTTRDGADA